VDAVQPVAAIGPMRKLRLLAPAAAPLALVPLAVRVHYPMDFGLAYHAGLMAWSSGNPETLGTWTGTPFLALVMAAITQVAPLDAATLMMLAVNLVVWGGLLLAVWHRLADLVPLRWWWGTLAAAAVFAPAISNIFWMQPNLVVVALALGGVALTGRRNLAAGLLIGAALALKPFLVLLPFAFLLHRESRRAGVWAMAVAAALSAIGLGFLAWRASDLSVANPIAYLAQFLTKGRGPDYACVPENYSPLALLCRFGVPPSTTLTVAVAGVVLVTGWLVTRRLRDVPESRWELFAAAGLLSPMLGPIGWANYQLLLAPLMLLLAFQFWAGRAPVFLWLNLGGVFLLTMLIWDPLESLALTPVPVLVVSYTLSQFAQYFLLLLWIQWMRLRSAKAAHAARTEMGVQAG
jgi:Glycosyltransferase family 87